jgi:CheY-like chemotaxis protein
MGRSGSGLGLAVVHGVVQDHDGKIDLHSEIGKGTEFTLYFPVTRERLWPVVEEEGNYSGEEKILVVDDLKEQRDLVSRLLSTLGYSVTAVENRREAVEYLKSNSTDLVILDMILEEGLDGLDTYRQILNVHPNQKAIVSSGFSVTDRVEEAQKLGAGQFLKKPYTLSRLGQAVRQELDAPSKAPTPEPV